jgi:hypothetical protein
MTATAVSSRIPAKLLEGSVVDLEFSFESDDSGHGYFEALHQGHRLRPDTEDPACRALPQQHNGVAVNNRIRCRVTRVVDDAEGEHLLVIGLEYLP